METNQGHPSTSTLSVSKSRSNNYKIKTFVVDAFTNKPFKGNPAGVCFMEHSLEVETMQSIAAEINLSETAFFTREAGADNKFTIRFFTPTVEIKFCGHATLGSAKAVLDLFNLSEVEFTTYHGLKILAAKEGDEIKMGFPVYDSVAFNTEKEVLDSFGIHAPLATRFAPATNMLLIEIGDLEALQSLNPDYARALASSDLIKQVIVTTRGRTNDKYDFYSRCFCPWIGINEDPVTGAAHSMLAPYWADKLGKKTMVAYQASKRGGYLKLNLTNDRTLEVKSNAIIMFEGVLEVEGVTAPQL